MAGFQGVDCAVPGESGGGAAVDGASESAPSAAPAPGVMRTANVGAMCRNDFKVSESAAAVFAEIADFATPPLVRDLFEKTSLKDMFAGIEANASKVCFSYAYFSFCMCWLYIA